MGSSSLAGFKLGDQVQLRRSPKGDVQAIGSSVDDFDSYYRYELECGQKCSFFGHARTWHTVLPDGNDNWPLSKEAMLFKVYPLGIELGLVPVFEETKLPPKLEDSWLDMEIVWISSPIQQYVNTFSHDRVQFKIHQREDSDSLLGAGFRPGAHIDHLMRQYATQDTILQFHRKLGLIKVTRFSKSALPPKQKKDSNFPFSPMSERFR